MAETARATGAGRPRDATIERRVLEAAIRQFGERGWSGLSIDKIAAATGVGKASIYLRWTSKEELVLAAIDAVSPQPSDADTGTIDGDLRVMVTELLDLYTSDMGAGVQRFGLDTDFPPALAERIAAQRTGQVRAWRRVIHRAIDRGWLHADTDIAFLLNLIHGTTWSYATTGNPAPRRQRRPAEDQAFVDQTIRLVVDRFGAPA